MFRLHFENDQIVPEIDPKSSTSEVLCQYWKMFDGGASLFLSINLRAAGLWFLEANEARLRRDESPLKALCGTPDRK